MVGKEEVVSKEHNGCKELAEAGLVLVGCQQLLQPNLLQMIMMVDICSTVLFLVLKTW